MLVTVGIPAWSQINSDGKGASLIEGTHIMFGSVEWPSKDLGMGLQGTWAGNLHTSSPWISDWAVVQAGDLRAFS